MSEEFPFINRKTIRKDRTLRRIQKQSIKEYKHKKGKYPKARIGKIVIYNNTCFDLTEHTESIKADSGLFNKIENAGLTGLSGNGFPTIKKIADLIESGADKKFLIVNGVECDPALVHDKWLLKNKFAEIESGINELKQEISFSKVILAVKEDLAYTGQTMEIYTVPNKFPMGEERVLINEILKTEISRNEIPAQKGILVLNIQTVYAINEIAKGVYQRGTRYITVADLTKGEAVTAKVREGMTVNNVLKNTIGFQDNRKIYIGGGAMKAHIAANNEKLTMGTNIIAYAYNDIFTDENKCKKCGICSRKCPMSIEVKKIVSLHQKGQLIPDDIQKKAGKCIKCGTCSYFCAAGKNIMKIVNMAK